VEGGLYCVRLHAAHNPKPADIRSAHTSTDLKERNRTAVSTSSTDTKKINCIIEPCHGKSKQPSTIHAAVKVAESRIPTNSTGLKDRTRQPTKALTARAESTMGAVR
jgi:hypothetical protein